MMNKLFKVILGMSFFTMISPNEAYSQCDVNTSATKLQIYCGEEVYLSAFGVSLSQSVLNEDFNASGFGPGWASTPGASGFGPGWASTPGATGFGNPCSPGGTDGTPHAWMDDNTSVPRTLESAPYDLSSATSGVTICFDLLFAEQGGNAPCEGPDEPDEGVFLEFSTDGGATWTEIHYFDPNGGYDPQLINWNNYCFELPPGAITSNTKVRWHQTADSGAEYDHWGIDNVQIYQNDVNAELVWLHDGYSYGVGNPGGENPTPVTPTTTTTYTAQITTGSGEVCTQNITIEVLEPNYVINITADPDEICDATNECTDVTATADVVMNSGGSFPFTDNDNVSISGSPGNPFLGPGSIDGTSTMYVSGLNMSSVSSGSISSICINNLELGGFICPEASLANITISIICPDNTEIVLANAGDLSGSTISNMCFADGGTPLFGGSQPYSGTFQPAQALDGFVGCSTEGDWQLKVQGTHQGFCIPFGSISSWGITFEEPPVTQIINYQWEADPAISDVNSLTPQICAPGTYTLNVDNGVAGCPTGTESITIGNACGCTSQSITTEPTVTVGCNATYNLADAIVSSSNGTIIFLDDQGVEIPSGDVTTAGVYTIRVVDTNDPTNTTCFAEAQVDVQYTTLTLTVNSDDEYCIGGSTVLSASATSGTVTWSDDFNGTHQDGATVSPVTTTVYTATADDNGCVVTESFTITVNENPTISLVDEIICMGDAITLSATVSPAGGTYDWESGASTADTYSVTPAGAGGSSVTNTYSVTYTDPNGCSSQETVDVIVNDCSCATPNVVMNDASICVPNTVDLSTLVDGASDPHTAIGFYASAADANSNTNAMASSTVAVSGVYYFRYENPSDPACFSVVGVTVTVNSLPSPQINIVSANCDGTSIDLETGQGYNTYSWTTGSSTYQANYDVAQSPASVTVTDLNGCSNTVSLDLVTNASVDLSLGQANQPSCPGVNDGSIVLSITGGVSPYNINWAHNASINTFAASGLGAGVYDIVVEDAAGCTDTLEYELFAPDTLRATINTTDATCYGLNDGTASVQNVENANGNITYIWSTNTPNPNSVDNSGNLYAGNHAVQIFDEEGCNYLIQFTIDQPDELRIDQFGVDSSSYCRGSGLYPGTGYASGIAVGGTGTPSYTWTDSTGAVITNTATAQDLVPGDYTLTVVDANGCTASETLYMDSINPRADFDVTPQQGEAPLDVLITDVSDGLAANGVLYWTLDTTNQTGQFTTTVSGSRDTVYTDWGDYVIELIVENGYGCRDTIYKTVNVFRPLDIMPPNVFTPDGDGNNDVFYIPVEGWSEYSIVVFDRWGLKLFETNDPNIGWNGQVNNDGAEVTEGVYFYTYRIVGENINDVREGRGNIHVIRN